MLDILGNRTAYPEVKEVLEKLTSDDALHRLYIGHGSSAAGSGEKRAACQQGVYFRKDFGSINPIAVFTGYPEAAGA